jgi:hypothetical protein
MSGRQDGAVTLTRSPEPWRQNPSFFRICSDSEG